MEVAEGHEAQGDSEEAGGAELYREAGWAPLVGESSVDTGIEVRGSETALSRPRIWPGDQWASECA